MKASIGAALLGVAVSLAAADTARAHAPQARDVALAPGDGSSLAIRMPGFGWLLRTASDAPFVYACDALLAVSPLEEHVPMAYRTDGSLLVGTALGVRMLDADGCPRRETFLAQRVVALAVHPNNPQRVYAATELQDGAPRIHRSEDGGETFVPAGLLEALPITGLALDASDPDRVFVSQRIAQDQTSILMSSDGGGSFERLGERGTDFALLYVHPDNGHVWGREPRNPRGVSIIRIMNPAEVGAEELLALNFFGGFAVDPADPDTLFVGDEARGIYRSGTAGERFRETLPDVASSGLAFGASGLWSTTPGLPHQPALLHSGDGVAAADPVMAFTDVRSLVECPSIDVEDVCAAAWIEWERDVLGALPMPDSGVEDAGAPNPDASAPNADASVTDASDSGTDGGCSCSAAGARGGRGATAWLVLLLALSVSAYRCGGPSSRG